MHKRLYIICIWIFLGGIGTNFSLAQSPEEDCQLAQNQLRYYFMEYNEEGYLNLKYLEDLYYSCDSVDLRSSISYYYLKAASLLEVHDNYVARPSELFYFYHKKFQESAAQSGSLISTDPDFVGTLDLRADQLKSLLSRAEAVGDKPYLDESRNRQLDEEGLRRKDVGGNRGGQESPPLTSSSSNIPDFASFPYPVKSASDSYRFDGRLFLQARSLGEINQQLSQALNAEGYYGKRYFALPEGFALVTQLERVYPDGKPLPTLERWGQSVRHQAQFSLREYMMSLVFAEQGYYRTFAFVVMPRSIAENPLLGLGRLDPKPWQQVEGEKLPEKIAQLSLDDGYVVMLYLFAFDVPGGAENAILMTLPAGEQNGSLVEKHLRQANLLPHLQP